jgi:hypothetical protein
MPQHSTSRRGSHNGSNGENLHLGLFRSRRSVSGSLRGSRGSGVLQRSNRRRLVNFRRILVHLCLGGGLQFLGPEDLYNARRQSTPNFDSRLPSIPLLDFLLFLLLNCKDQFTISRKWTHCILLCCFRSSCLGRGLSSYVYIRCTNTRS